MLYSFARVSAVLKLTVDDYFTMAPVAGCDFMKKADRLSLNPNAKKSLSQMDRSEEAAYDIVLNVAYYGTLKYRSDVERRSGVKVSTSGGSAG